MPILIDGNNLLHALASAGSDPGRGGLCRMLGELAARGERVRVVFDGTPPTAPLAEPIGDDRIDVAWSGRQTADAVIVADIAADTAPRRLTVVSTDHEIRAAARRRRCRSVRSEDFARALLLTVNRPPLRLSVEPPEKHAGLAEGEADRWMEELGLTDVERPKDLKP